ncbi:MAG: hypothetical protein IIB95_04190 [Candidatus Marinimicrobia bacterium]|nr:hypothetical protein [Candidatus Neomarinimicrobiota bacterium]MCH7762924.1 hypothetical protein [Candidatus Neomarinimicrobiota bacterium]
MWKTILIITLLIAGLYLVFIIIKHLLSDREKTKKEKLSKKVTEEMAKKIMEDARMHRKARNGDD